jgi:hypothetical protein
MIASQNEAWSILEEVGRLWLVEWFKQQNQLVQGRRNGKIWMECWLGMMWEAERRPWR